MYDVVNNAVLVSRKDSDRVFFVFTGKAQRVGGLGPLEFLDESGLKEANVAFLADPKVTGFLHGCSNEIADLDDLMEWLKSLRTDRFGHCRTAICMGVSSGAPAAMYAAEYLGAQASMTFGPRCFSLALHGQVEGAGAPVTPTPLERVPHIWNRLKGKVMRKLGRRVAERWPPHVLRAAYEDFAPILGRLGTSESAAMHHCLYCRTNQPDSSFVDQVAPTLGDRLVRHEIDGSGAPDDHLLIPILLSKNRLRAEIDELVQDVEVRMTSGSPTRS
jgi:hypothetical protein